MFHLKKTITLMAAALFVASLALVSAQVVEKKAKFHPDDVVPYDIHFEGPDAAVLKSANLTLQLQGGTLPSQPGFITDTVAPAIPILADHNLHGNVKIPQHIATGDYTLIVDAYGDGNSPHVQYRQGIDFTAPTIHVDNEETFRTPKISVKIKP